MPSPKLPPVPKKVRVAGKDFRVQCLPQAKMLDQSLGLFDPMNHIIQLANEQAPAEKAESLLHEVVHACCSERNIGFDEATEEKFVDAVSTSLFAVLRDNPKLVNFIVKTK